MNILYIPQLSMYNKKTKKYIPEADGNINMMRNFINEWHKYRKEDNFYILLPSQLYMPYDNCTIFNDNYNKFILYYEEYVISARINRYNFPMNELIRIYSTLKPDLIINDIPELSRNIIAMAEVEFNHKPKVISNIRHIDEPSIEKNRYDYFWRLIDGIECSDMCTILSQSMKEMLYDEMKYYLNPNKIDDLIEKIEVFEPSVSMEELLNIELQIISKQEKIITFPGRLSKGEENRTNWDKFIDAIHTLRYNRTDFEVYLTDPNNGTDWIPGGFIKTIKKDRKEFINLLHKTDIIVSLMDIQGFGGISIREALICGCMPIIPYKHEYKRMQDKTYPGFIHGDITVEKIVEKLNWALDNIGQYSSQNYGKQFCIEWQMKDFIKKLEVITDEKF